MGGRGTGAPRGVAEGPHRGGARGVRKAAPTPTAGRHLRRRRAANRRGRQARASLRTRDAARGRGRDGDALSILAPDVRRACQGGPGVGGGYRPPEPTTTGPPG